MALKFNPFTGKLDFTGSASGGGSGTVTSVTGGTGLDGGTITTTGTFSVKYGTTAGTAAEGNDARLSDARIPTGSAGGDLAGTYPNPTVDGLQGNPVSAATPASGQTLQWNGSAWVPGAIPNGGSGGGGLVYFLNYQNTTGISPTTGLPTSPVAVSQLGRNYSVGSGSITSANLTQGSYSLICGFVTVVAEPGVTDIPAGLWDFNIWVDVLGGTGGVNQTQFQIRVYKYDSTAGTYTSLANSDDVYVYDPVTIAQYIANVTMPQTTILATDRIYVELWAQKNVNQSRQIRFYFDSLHPSHGHTTLPSVAGNGVVKVVNGVFQSPASLIVNTDVDANAAIDVSKLSGVVANGGGVPTVIEVTEAQYKALTPVQVDQTATYIVNSTTTQNATTYQGKEFGGSKPVSLLAQPVVVGNVSPLSSTINTGSVDWVQASPFDANKFYFSQNIGGAFLAAMWRGTLTKDSSNRISGGTNSYSGQQSLTYPVYGGSKGGGIYDADTVFIPDEKYSAGDTNGYGRIVKVDLATNTTSDAWNFQTSTPAVSRADIASQLWYPEDCIVDRANNKLFVSSTYASATTEGSSVARFSIDPTTKVLTPDSWVKAVTPNGSNICFISRLTLLPDGYIFVSNYSYATNALAFQSFDAYGSAAGNAASVGITFASGNLLQGVAFKPDTNAPSGIGYILIAPRAGSEAGKIYAYDYQGAGVFNTTATDNANLTTIAKNAGLWTNAFNLEIGSISVTADGSILCGIRSTGTTPIPRAVIAFNWIPYSKSGSLSTQNLDNVNIIGGSISGVRNLTPKVEYINSTRYWNKDELAKYIRVQAWGAGGGGGSGRKDSSAIVVRSGGAGGGGGAYVDTFIDASAITSSQTTITIGGGGNGGAAQTTNATNGNPGTAGGNTLFGNFVRALGGALGGGGTAAAVTGGAGAVNGNAGGGSSATGGAGTQGSPLSTTSPIGLGGAGGGGGGGLTTANATSAGGSAGNSYYGAAISVTSTGGTAGGGAGAAGVNPTNLSQVGTSGGGGGSNTTGDGGAGGAGGFGSGGGGGGASQNGNSGAGGVGGNGFMIVTTFY